MRALTVVALLSLLLAITAAWSQSGALSGPNVVAPDRYVYYPGTEVLAEGEVRVIACGPGMPDQRDVANMRRIVKCLLGGHMYPLSLLFWEAGSLVERPLTHKYSKARRRPPFDWPNDG